MGVPLVWTTGNCLWTGEVGTLLDGDALDADASTGAGRMGLDVDRRAEAGAGVEPSSGRR